MDARRKDRTRFIYRLRAEARDDRGNAFSGHLVDVTLDGMMLIGNADYAPQTPLSLSIDLPRNAMGGGQIDFQARVRWCDAEEEPGLHAIGVSLEAMSAQARRTLEELMARFQEQADEAASEAEDDYVHNHGDDPFVHNR